MNDRRVVVAVLGLLVFSSGCSMPTGGSDGPESESEAVAEIDTTYTRIAGEGYIDMSLDVAHPGGGVVLLDGRLVARDADGAELPEVEVSTAFGTEDGRALVMPGGALDFVQLDGAGEELVRDVTLEDVRVTPVDQPPVDRLVELTSLDADDREAYDLYARRLRLDNPNPQPVQVRVVLMGLRRAQTGVPQEAVLVHDVGEVEVAADDFAVVDVDAGTRALMRQAAWRGAFLTFRPVLAPDGSLQRFDD